MLQRALARGYQSDWAQAHLPTRRERNAFYTQMGHLIPPGRQGIATLEKLDPGLSPRDIVSRFM
jgi:hypothetical protein